MTRPSRLRTELRQRRHHRAFRIADMPDQLSLEEAQQLLADVTAVAPAPDEPFDEKALAQAATSLWKAQRKLTQDADGASKRAMAAAQYLAKCREWLAELGVVVQDHDGDPYHPGRRLEVLTFEDDPHATTERVLHTYRPSIYWRDRHIQIGQVGVGCPVSGQRREGNTHA